MKTSVSGVKSQVSGEELDTQKVWSPIAQLQAQHEQALRELNRAVINKDEVAMKKAFDSIQYIQEQSPQLYQQARRYALSKCPRVKVQ